MTGVAFAVLALLAAPAAVSEPINSPWIVAEPGVQPHNATSSSWVRGERPSADHVISLTVSLLVDADRRAELERVFWEVSDPQSAKYGQHLSQGELAELLAVPGERVNRVREHFMVSGADKVEISPFGDLLTVTMPVAALEQALQTTLNFFTHRQQPDVRIIRASSTYALPADIAQDVVMVGELLQFPRLLSPGLKNLTSGTGSWPNACTASSCNGLVTPAVLAQRYKIPTEDSSNSSSSSSSSSSSRVRTSMAVAEFQGEHYKTDDVEGFGQACHRDVKVDHMVGTHVESAGVESELDIEYIKAVAPGAELTVVYQDDYSLLKWVNTITSMQNAPLVHSVSYGNDEAQQTSKEYMFTCNTQFMKAGAMGLSILFASGDQGACGREGCGMFRFHFHPDFPAASPYITAVGGTDFYTDSIGEEMSWPASGGGFSDTFDIPDYQKSAVAAYKASSEANLPPQQYWNATGRGYPDVSALGGEKAPYCVKTEGSFTGVAGTSASCPVVAGVFARLNALRQQHSQKPLGFLNPFIYANPGAFQDVTKGMNNYGRKYGFSAIKGWDAATGLGTPDFDALSSAALASGARTASDGEMIVV